MHTWIAVRDPADYGQLDNILSPEFSPKAVAELLEQHLSPNVKGILAEYPYVDKDYRSTYYGFYAKKALRYDPFCFRLHFFTDRVSLSSDLELQTTSASNRLSDDYFGYMVIRPTGVTPIGRTVISIDAVNGFSGAVIDAEYHVHVLGHRLVVRGFPFMQQHTDIAVCAHAACWSILRHYSERYSHYAERLVYDITKMASTSEPGGISPSRGLAITQASEVFSKAGMFPDLYARRDFKDNFDRMLAAYVESGFPVFVSLAKKQHAIAVIGHGSPDRNLLQSSTNLQYCWDATNSLCVVDDNLMPYQMIDGLQPNLYKIDEIDGFIVPLPEKIYFTAEAVEYHIDDAIENGVAGLTFGHLISPIARYFITTAATLKLYFRENKSQFPSDLYLALIELALPQFVWVVELSSLASWQKNSFNTLMLLDATASALDVFPYIVVTDRNEALIYDRSLGSDVGVITFTTPLTQMSELRKNLTFRF